MHCCTQNIKALKAHGFREYIFHCKKAILEAIVHRRGITVRIYVVLRIHVT